MTAGGFESQNKLAHRGRWRKRDIDTEKTVLTCEVAGEEKHHGEYDQERDVCLQDSYE